MCQTQWESKRRTPAGSSLAGVLLFCTNLTQPTGALDSKTGRMIMDIFHRLNEEQGKTIVLITHSQELAEETQRIVTLKDGIIIGERRGSGC